MPGKTTIADFLKLRPRLPRQFLMRLRSRDGWGRSLRSLSSVASSRHLRWAVRCLILAGVALLTMACYGVDPRFAAELALVPIQVNFYAVLVTAVCFILARGGVEFIHWRRWHRRHMRLVWLGAAAVPLVTFVVCSLLSIARWLLTQAPSAVASFLPDAPAVAEPLEPISSAVFVTLGFLWGVWGLWGLSELGGELSWLARHVATLLEDPRSSVVSQQGGELQADQAPKLLSFHVRSSARKKRVAYTLTFAALHRLYVQSAERLGIRPDRLPRLVVTDSESVGRIGPHYVVTWKAGAVIVLPSDLSAYVQRTTDRGADRKGGEWNVGLESRYVRDCLRVILLHELSHHRAIDHVMQFWVVRMSRILCWPAWFLMESWGGYQALDLAVEASCDCDAFAAMTTSRAADDGQHVVEDVVSGVLADEGHPAPDARQKEIEQLEQLAAILNSFQGAGGEHAARVNLIRRETTGAGSRWFSMLPLAIAALLVSFLTLSDAAPQPSSPLRWERPSRDLLLGNISRVMDGLGELANRPLVLPARFPHILPTPTPSPELLPPSHAADIRHQRLASTVDAGTRLAPPPAISITPSLANWRPESTRASFSRSERLPGNIASMASGEKKLTDFVTRLNDTKLQMRRNAQDWNDRLAAWQARVQEMRYAQEEQRRESMYRQMQQQQIQQEAQRAQQQTQLLQNVQQMQQQQQSLIQSQQRDQMQRINRP
ncbi:MAG: hypothetical protein NTY19_50630 [Planctomycetota bacterium]|nr:hypothetical protein [Planctomycetota bacterium]